MLPSPHSQALQDAALRAPHSPKEQPTAHQEGEKAETSLEDKTEGGGTVVLEEQVCFSYSRHNVSVPATGGWAYVGPLLQSSLQAHPVPPLIGSYSCALYFGTKTVHPSSTPTPLKGLAEMGSVQVPLCAGCPSPTPALWPLHLITCLLCLLDDIWSCSQMQFQVS